MPLQRRSGGIQFLALRPRSRIGGKLDKRASSFEREAQETKSSGHWSSLPQIDAIATCTAATINLVYPDVNRLLRPFLQTVISPLRKQPELVITIMWSSTLPLAKGETILNINHFVPLVEDLVSEAKQIAKQTNIRSFFSKGFPTAFSQGAFQKMQPANCKQLTPLAAPATSTKRKQDGNQVNPPAKSRKQLIPGSTCPSLDSLLRISIDGPPLSEWDGTRALELWWKEKNRRLGMKEKTTRLCDESSTCSTNTETDTAISFDEWEEWLSCSAETESLSDYILHLVLLCFWAHNCQPLPGNRLVVTVVLAYN